MLKPALTLLDREPPSWFTDVDLVLPSYIIMGLWGVFGANTVILLAGLNNIPRDLYEAATLDGAGRVRRYLTVTIPMLSPTLFYVLIMGIIGSLQTFTVAFFINQPRRAGTTSRRGSAHRVREIVHTGRESAHSSLYLASL